MGKAHRKKTEQGTDQLTWSERVKDLYRKKYKGLEKEVKMTKKERRTT